MLKKRFLVGSVLIALLNGAQAANSVDLKVTGTLRTGACAPSFANNGVVDFGHIPLGNLNKTETNQLGYKNITLTITCDNAIPIGWRVIDNKKETLKDLTIKSAKPSGADVSGSDWEFGLGVTAGNIKIGAYSMYVYKDEVTADGVKAKMMYTESSNLSDKTKWAASGAGEVNSINTRVYSIEATTSSDGTFLPAKVSVWPFKIAAAIQGTDTLAITENTNLEGSATIALVYL